MAYPTTAEVREHITTTLGDTALARLIDAAKDDINARLGDDDDEAVEVYRPTNTSVLFLRRWAGEISAISEHWDRYLMPGTYEWPFGSMQDIELDPSDYDFDRNVLQRRFDGLNPSYRWGDVITVTYTGRGTEAIRARALIALVKLDINYEPGLNAKTVGAVSRSYRGQYAQERANILDSLLPMVDMAVG